MKVRLFHFSDIHFTAKPLGWQRSDWLSKRTTGWVNIRLLGRGRRFRHAPEATQALMRAVESRSPEGLIFSGDASKLGFAAEIERAAKALHVGEPDMPPGLAVPGNHDRYIPKSVTGEYFEKAFAPWQVGERIDGHTYPFARKFGHVWFIAINSSTPNKGTLDASGEIGAEQLERVRALCDKLDDGLRIIVTHYPLCDETGKPEHRLRRLRDLDAVMQFLQNPNLNIRLWLHGHIHRPFLRGRCAKLPVPVICAGSATQTDRWSFFEYTIEDQNLLAIRFRYQPKLRNYAEVDRLSLNLG
ncbi:MAG: metallophosphoesterase family protein [Fimbriiglobus sp.]